MILPWKPGEVKPFDRPKGRAEPAQTSRFGTLSIRVQPSGASVLIDGQRWEGPQGDDERLTVQVAEGRHQIQVEKDGFAPYSTDVEVIRGRTEPVDVSLTRDR